MVFHGLFLSQQSVSEMYVFNLLFFFYICKQWVFLRVQKNQISSFANYSKITWRKGLWLGHLNFSVVIDACLASLSWKVKYKFFSRVEQTVFPLIFLYLDLSISPLTLTHFLVPADEKELYNILLLYQYKALTQQWST